MANRPFGIILREARERQGYSLEDASKYLRIRADILSAIEHSDFDNMPARGYAKNMVGAYARMLGLNAPAITRQYIQEIDEYQLYASDSVVEAYNRSLISSRGGGVGADGASGFGGGAGQQRNMRQNERENQQRSRSRNSQYNTQQNLQRSAQRSSQRGSQRSSQRGGDYGGAHNRRTQQGDNPLVHTKSMQPYGGRASRNGGPREEYTQRGLLTSVFSSNFSSKLPLLIAVIFAIIVVVFLVTQIVSCVAPKQTSTNTSVPITGVSDTTGQANNSSSSNTSATLAAPTSCTVTYTVDSGVEVWTEIYENDSTTASVAEVISGPATSAYTVTGKWKITVPTNLGVKVTVDGSEVELTTDDSGYYTYTVDFAKILNDWAQKNKQNTSTDSANSNSSSGSGSDA